jgi:type IV pilus assembly protein PilC
MAIFKYKAINKRSEVYEDAMQAPDRFAVYQNIKSKGDTVVYVKEVKNKAVKAATKITDLLSRIKTYDKIIFAKNLGAMIKAGLALTRALSVMEKQTKNKKLKKVISNVREDISRGQSLSESMKSMPDVFSSLFVSMVKAGEESGQLSGSLKTISMQMERSYVLTRKIRGAMIYPTVVVSLMIAIGILMMVYMVPTLTATFEGLGVELPATTRIIIAISNFLRTQYLVALSFIITLAFLLFITFKSKRGKRVMTFATLHLPVIGNIVKEVNAARTARTFSSLLSSGVDVVIAMEVTSDVIQNVFFKEVLEKAQKSIEKGELISAIFLDNTHLYPVFLGEMVSVGEETGQLSQMLTEVADFYEGEVDQKTKNMSTIIEPFLMIIVGIAVGFFAISMLAPTYSLVETI